MSPPDREHAKDVTDAGVAVNANDVVAFFVELSVLAVLGVWGFRMGGPTWAKVVLATGLPLVAAVLWGLWAAPRARFHVPWATVLVKVVVLGAGAVGGFVVLPPAWASVFAVLVVANLVLMYVGPFAR